MSQKREVCAVCRGTSFVPLYVLDGFSIVRCASCSLVQRDILLSPEESKALYTDTYFCDAHRDYFLTYEHEKEKRFADIIRQHSSVIPAQGSVLDVGCGIGTFLHLAESLGYEVSGQDISSTSIALARERSKAHLFVGTLHERAYPADSFDVITSWDSLNHSEYPQQVLEEAYRILRKDGVLLVQMNAQDSFLCILANMLYRLSGGLVTIGVSATYPIHQSTFFTLRTLRDALHRAGFEVLVAERRIFHTQSCSVIRRSLLHKYAFSIINFIGNILGRPMNLLMVAQKK